MLYITPYLIVDSSALDKPRVSKLKPNDPASYYLRARVTAEAAQTAQWKALEDEVKALGEQTFGGATAFSNLLTNGQFRSPIRKDLAGRGWPSDIVAFVNLKASIDYPPVVVGRDAQPIMNSDEIYPGAIVRASVRLYAYGGRGSSIGAGISFGLVNVQKLRDGPRLKNAKADGAEFSFVGDPESVDMMR